MVQAYNFLASWQLFPEKGTYEYGERPKSGIYKIEAVPDQKVLAIYHNWVTLENQAFASNYKINADGDLNEFDNHELADKVQAAIPDGITFEIHFYKKGEIALHKKNNSKDWGRNLLLLSGFLGGLVLLYFLIVPWLAEKMASTVSVKTERQLGDAVYDAMGLSAAEDTAASFLLNEFFATMEVPSAYSVRITVVNDNVVNAFAVPGGRIVVYSALLKQIQSYPELAALLSHEFTHVNNKHSTKSIFRRLGSKVFIGLLFGSFGSVTSVLIDHADDLKSLTYSRKLEKEADIKGLEILLQRKIDPKGFEDLFHHLKEASPASALPEFLASHPDVEKRISYIKESSKNATTVVDQRLQSIFEKIKQ